MGCCSDRYIPPDIIAAPGESIVYVVDWPNRGLPPDTTIVSQRYLPTGTTDYTITNEEIIDNAQQTQFQLTGGIPGTFYDIVNEITLSDSEVMQATIVYLCVAQNINRTDNSL